MTDIEKNIKALSLILDKIDTPLSEPIKVNIEGIELSIAGDTKWNIYKLLKFALGIEKEMDIETQESYIGNVNNLNSKDLAPSKLVKGITELFDLVDNNELEKAKELMEVLDKEILFDDDLSSHIPMTIRRKEIMGEVKND